MPDFDAIIIGAGHNGLTAANVLAKAGASVLVVERNHFVGGMAATRTLFDGYQHSVGAWAVLVWSEQMTKRLEIEDFGYELVPQWSSACTFGDDGDVPFVLYNDMERMATHMLEDHGPEVSMAAGELFAHVGQFDKYFRQAMFDPDIDIFEVIAEQADRETRRAFADMWFGPAMDIVRRFIPADMARTLQGSMAAMAVDGFDGGPWTPGSGASLIYHYMLRSPGEMTDRIVMPRGGIGNLSKALQRRAESMGAEVRLATPVKSIVVDTSSGSPRATGVTLRDGSTVTADVVCSTADPYTTFLGLTGEQHFPTDFVRKLREINFDLGYIQAHMTIEGDPEWIERLQPFVSDNGHQVPTLAYLPSAEYVADGWDQYRAGRFPESNPPAYLYLPSYCDKTLAPEGHHSATIYAQYFPVGMDADEHREQKERYADACLATIERFSPGFRDRIGERVVLSNRYFGSAFSAHKGDFAHGTLSPVQIWNRRGVPGESQYSTPVDNLFLVGQGAHPGPGVTGLPGWNGGQTVVERLNSRNPAR